MNSSTSNFKDEIKVITTIILAVFIWELTARLVAKILDYDRKHIHEFPTLSKQLHETLHTKVLFLGNSLTLRGVNEEWVKKELAKKNMPVACCKIAPVATAIIDWIYIYEKYFEQTGQNPDVVVIGFVAHHIPDVPTIKIPRLTRHFVSGQSFPELFREDIHEFDDRFKAVLCFVSAGFGDQPEHKYRIQDPIIADFREGTRRVNNLSEANARKKSSTEVKPTYVRLKRMLELLGRNKVHGVFVAMPMPGGWELDPQIEKIVQDAGMTFVDARHIPEIKEEDYADGYHLGEIGAEKYSHFLAEKLAEILPGLPKK